MVAVVAVISRSNVIDRLARGLKVVMAPAAAPGHCRMVHIENGTPSCCRVAILANRRRSDMVRLHCGRSHCAAGRVAGHAVWIRSRKDGTNVTTFTGYVGVSAVENEPCTEMIEVILRLRR